MPDERAAAAALLERLLTDAEFRATYRRDPAAAARAAGFAELAPELALPERRALETLDGRESRQAIAGVLMAAAIEGIAVMEFAEHVVPHLDELLPGVEEAQAAVAPGGGLRALLDNDHVAFDAAGLADLRAGRIDTRIVAVLGELGRRHELVVSSMRSDHPKFTAGGSVSNHFHGRAVDIAMVDGEPVNASNEAARRLAMALDGLDPAIRPDEIGSPWALPGAAHFTDAEHQDHLHIGFDEPGPGAPAHAAAVHHAVSIDDGDDGAPEALPDAEDEDDGDDDGDDDEDDEDDGDDGDDEDPEGPPSVGDDEDEDEPDEDEPDEDEPDEPGPGDASDVSDGDSDEDPDSHDDDSGSSRSDDGSNSGGDESSGDVSSGDVSSGDADDVDDGGDDGGADGDDGDVDDVDDDDGDDDDADDGDDDGLAPADGSPLAYPGDDAGPPRIAAWMAAQARRRGVPPELPVMAALVESGMTNADHGDADSLGFFQMRTSVWDSGAYEGYARRPELQLQWFLDTAERVGRDRRRRGLPMEVGHYGEWIADVERPAAQFRGRYQLRLEEARKLLRGASAEVVASVADSARTRDARARVLPIVAP